MDDQPDENERLALAALRQSRSLLASPESGRAALAFQPRRSDVFVTTAPKCGTTWMTQICHQLRSGGDMDFDELTRVVPFLELGVDMGQDLDADHAWKPRVFKTHLSRHQCPKGGRYITVVRHPYDVAVSQWAFHQGWMFSHGAIRCNTYVQQIWLKSGQPAVQDLSGGYLQSGTALHHYMSWWPQRHNPNVLFVFYEDMKENLEREISRVASFLGITDPTRIANANEMASFEFMYANQGKFDDNFVKSYQNTRMGLAESAGSNKACGKVSTAGGKRDLLNMTSRGLIDQVWAEVCQPVTNASSYDDWRKLFHDEQCFQL